MKHVFGSAAVLLLLGSVAAGLLWLDDDESAQTVDLPIAAPASLATDGDEDPIPALNPGAEVDAVSAAARGRDAVPVQAGPLPTAREPRKQHRKPTVPVRVVLAPNPWLDGSPVEGAVKWGLPGAAQQSLKLRLDGSLTGELELPSAPTSKGDFGEVHVAGFVASPVALRELGSTAEPSFELQADWMKGATLVWAESVPIVERTDLSVGLGGRVSPASISSSFQNEHMGRVEARTDVELPLVLPRLKTKEVVWVGATGREWRALRYAADAREIRVSLNPAGAIRVRHDGPAEAFKPHIFVAGVHVLTLLSQPIKDSKPVLFTEIAAGTHNVWIAKSDQRSSEEVSARVAVEVIAGETVEVDLTAHHAEEALGGLRVHVYTNETVLDAAKGRLTLRASRRELGRQSKWPWGRPVDLARVESVQPEHRLYEATKLLPGIYRVNVEPFGASVTAEVVARETRDVNLRLQDLAWVEIKLPPEYHNGGGFLALRTTEAKRGEQRRIRLGQSSLRSPKPKPFPVTPGTYVAELDMLSRSDLPSLVSQPFSAQAGATISVSMAPLEKATVHLEARHAVTDEPVTLPMKFWMAVSATNTVTDEPHRGWTSFHGPISANTGITWTLTTSEDPVRIDLPESPFWTLDPPDPIQLQGETTVVLRAHPK